MIKIHNNNIGCGNPAYIVAEISANHCGDIELAKKMIEEAHKAGADAVKTQTYTADTLTINCDNDYFKINSGTLWDGKTLYDLYKEAYTPWEWQRELKKHADAIGITLFSSPFDKTAVDFLEEINIPAFKIASFEAVDIPLIEYTASKGKPVIISTGICSKQEIQESIDACKRMGNEQIILLKCTSAYPAKPEDMDLLTIQDMQKTFKAPIGLSDHTLDIETPIIATALGVCVIEKHFILNRNMGGADAAFSLNVDEFKQMAQSIRKTEKILGKVSYKINEKNRQFARSLFVVKDIQEGEVLTTENIRSIRPGDGLEPSKEVEILGKKTLKCLKKGTPLKMEYIDL